MVGIPGGAFVMGNGSRDPAAAPAHRVVLPAFALGRDPVTVAEWRACAAEGGCGPLPRMAVASDGIPLHNASWDDARQYAGWLSRRTGKPYRLPSEAEWEYAARGGTATRYWWGQELGKGMADCVACGSAPDARAPLPADGFRPNPFGLRGMLGGVAQWTADCWSPNYRGAPADGRARDAPGCMKKVLRGGGFRALPQDLTVTARGSYDGPVRYLLNGFRVARDLDR
jgi:formylglycine-generating enzyme required for sulfatase activity